MSHPKHLDGSVDKGDMFIESGMTLITEVDSERHLKKSAEIKRQKSKMDDFVERWSDWLNNYWLRWQSMATTGIQFKDINISVKKHPVTDDIVLSKDASAIKQAIVNILLTNKGERLFNFEFGSSIRQYLFEPLDFATAGQVSGSIKSTLAKFDIKIIEGPIKRIGATSNLLSIYCKDPDGNLIEISNVIDKEW